MDSMQKKRLGTHGARPRPRAYGTGNMRGGLGPIAARLGGTGTRRWDAGAGPKRSLENQGRPKRPR